MGLLKNLLLVAGGAAAGYLATRPRPAQTSTGELELKAKSTLERFTSEGGTMAQFFDSAYGRPFKATALKALKFAATVKSGMDEKEAELKTRYENQTKDVRPGSLDTWQQDLPQGQPERYLVLEALPGDTTSSQQREADFKERLARDQALGKDFFA